MTDDLTDDPQPGRRMRRRPTPLDQQRLEELAVAYVARFAVTRSMLLRYLRRKLRERGWSGDGEADLDALCARHVRHGYVDDGAYARAKAGSMLRRGYGARRIGDALAHAGVETDLRDAIAPDEAQARHAALALARRRRFGPFAAERPDRPLREKQLAAMLRAGHSVTHACAILDAGDAATAEEWAREHDEEG